MCFVVILSDKSIREALASKRIIIDPLDESCLQPSSIDVKVSNLFRVFRNHTSAVIDVKKDLADLTPPGKGPFASLALAPILHHCFCYFRLIERQM